MVQEKSAVREQQEEEYEFFKAGIDGRKEGEKGTDKRFGKPPLLIRKFQSKSGNEEVTPQAFLSMILVVNSCHWGHPGSRGGGVHGEAVQEQAQGHENLCLPHTHQDVCTDGCCRYDGS